MRDLNKVQTGYRLCKDVKDFLSGVKVMHGSSKRVSGILKETYSRVGWAHCRESRPPLGRR